MFINFGNNNLSSPIPQCLGNSILIKILNMIMNKFNGRIPQMFTNRCDLISLKLMVINWKDHCLHLWLTVSNWKFLILGIIMLMILLFFDEKFFINCKCLYYDLTISGYQNKSSLFSYFAITNWIRNWLDRNINTFNSWRISNQWGNVLLTWLFPISKTFKFDC